MNKTGTELANIITIISSKDISNTKSAKENAIMRIAILTILLVLSTNSWGSWGGTYTYYHNFYNGWDGGEYCQTEPTPTHSVPEPETMMLFGLGLVAVGMMKRRKK